MINIAVVSNVCVEPYWRLHMEETPCKHESNIHMHFIAYDEHKSSTRDLAAADFVVILLNFEMLYPNLLVDIQSGNYSYDVVEQNCISKCKELYTYVKSNCDAPIIWFGFEDYYCLQYVYFGAIAVFDGVVDRINIELGNLIKPDLFVDLKRLIAVAGVKNAYDTKGKYRWNSPYSKTLIGLIVEDVLKQYEISSGHTKKCLILDCDNVLWGGVLSEDGVEGLQLGETGWGRYYQDFQRMVLDIHYHGVILAVCSKNDESAVLRVFKEHTGMILDEKHIACFRCNWGNKPSNIKDIAQQLNISLNSMVFVDDSPLEINAVQTLLPEVKTILFSRGNVHQGLHCFNLRHNVDVNVSRQRTETYRLNEKRTSLRAAASSYEEYLLSLEMEIDIHKTVYQELGRVAELTQRTNRCTNGRRYTLKTLKKAFEQSDYALYTVCLKDRFSDLGIVGAIGITDGKIDLFSLSCRALGREIENKMISFAKDQGALTIDFALSSSNQMLQKILVLHKLLNENTE